MKVLVVEDENEKAKKIVEVLKHKGNLKDEDVIVEVCINNALRQMTKITYDLLIVDMRIPRTFGTALIDDGAIELLATIDKDKHILAPHDIVVLTAHPELKDKYNDIVLKSSFNMIVWNDSSIEWEEYVISKLSYRRRVDLRRHTSSEYEYDVGIITSVEVEKEAVGRIWEWKDHIIDGDSANYYSVEIDNQGTKILAIWVNLPQMGMVAATAYTMKLIYNFRPHFIIMPGIAGGTNTEYGFGDIILPGEIKDYCSGKYTTPKDTNGVQEAKNDPLKFFVPTANSFNTDEDVINFVKGDHKQILYKIWNEWRNKAEYKIPEIRTGFLACGTSVIQNDEIVKRMILPHQRKTDGLDMESYGMYFAAKNSSLPKPIPICMKAISDFSDKEKKDDHQAYAAYVSASFMRYFIEEYIKKPDD